MYTERRSLAWVTAGLSRTRQHSLQLFLLVSLTAILSPAAAAPVITSDNSGLGHGRRAGLHAHSRRHQFLLRSRGAVEWHAVGDVLYVSQFYLLDRDRSPLTSSAPQAAPSFES